MKHYKIITTDDLIIGTGLTDEELAYLYKLFDLSKYEKVYKDFDTLTLFEGDPDYIKVFGKAGRVEIPFITVTVDDTTIYIYYQAFI